MYTLGVASVSRSLRSWAVAGLLVVSIVVAGFAVVRGLPLPLPQTAHDGSAAPAAKQPLVPMVVEQRHEAITAEQRTALLKALMLANAVPDSAGPQPDLIGQAAEANAAWADLLSPWPQSSGERTPSRAGLQDQPEEALSPPTAPVSEEPVSVAAAPADGEEPLSSFPSETASVTSQPAGQARGAIDASIRTLPAQVQPQPAPPKPATAASEGRRAFVAPRDSRAQAARLTRPPQRSRRLHTAHQQTTPTRREPKAALQLPAGLVPRYAISE